MLCLYGNEGIIIIAFQQAKWPRFRTNSLYRGDCLQQATNTPPLSGHTTIISWHLGHLPLGIGIGIGSKSESIHKKHIAKLMWHANKLPSMPLYVKIVRA